MKETGSVLNGIRYIPRFFERDWESGRPKLSEAGKKAVEEEARRVEAAASQ
jgi:hypothetical protein